MNLTVLGKRLLIEPMYDQIISNIHIPDVVNGKKWMRNTGTLHAFGEKAHEMFPELKRGMTVIFKPYDTGNREIELRGKTFLLIEPEALLGVVE